MKATVIQKGSKEHLIKAYTFLNNLYASIEDTRAMNNAWSKLIVHMGDIDGVEARRLLTQWKMAGNYEF